MKIINTLFEKIFDFIFLDRRSGILWFFIRVYVGFQWLIAGWEKFGTIAWTGSSAGSAIQGFINGALTKTQGAHPDVSLWYAWFLTHFVAQHLVIFSYLITFGEIFAGVALILGFFTTFAAASGAFMNFNYLFAGTVSTNPWLLFLELLLLAGRKVAGVIGFDSFKK